MNEPLLKPVAKANWRDLYGEALVELNPANLGGKIDRANAAIHQRLCELASDASKSSDEQQAMTDALRNLQAIRGMNTIASGDAAQETTDRTAPGRMA